MANQKITDYSALTGSGVDIAADLLEIVDAGAGSNKKITVAELFKSPSVTLVTPILGTATSGDLSACTTSTQAVGDNSTKLASTAYADAATGGTLATEQSASGATVDFTGIPATAKWIRIMFNGISTNGSSLIMVQLGDSGGFETTGYLSGASDSATEATDCTTGFLCASLGNSGASYQGMLYLGLQKASTNEWVGQGGSHSPSNRTAAFSGSKSLSGTLDRVRFTTVNGTDTFDAGTISIAYGS